MVKMMDDLSAIRSATYPSQYFVYILFEFHVCCGYLHIYGQSVPQADSPMIWAILYLCVLCRFQLKCKLITTSQFNIRPKYIYI